jgi:hypothetical protein
VSLPAILAAGQILVVHRLLVAGLDGFEQLRTEDYRRRFLLPRALRRPRVLALAVLPAVLLTRAHRCGWESLGAGAFELRTLATVLALTLAWEEVTAPPNYYFRRRWAADRWLTLLSAASVALHPAFILCFLVAWLPLVWQVKHPACFAVGLHPLVDKSLPQQLLILLAAASAGAWASDIDLGLLPVLLLSAVAAHYFVPALAKLRLGKHPCAWLLHNRMSNLLVTMHNYGWLRSRWSTAAVARWAQRLRPFDPWLNGAVLAIELGSLLLLADHRLALALLAAFVVLHLGILAVAGIFFWKWLPPLVLVFVGVARLSGVLFNSSALLVSAVILAVSPLFFRPFWLGWWDMPINHFFRLHAVGDSGRVYDLGLGAVAPYDQCFGQTTFGFLVETPMLVGAMGGYEEPGAQGRELLRELENTGGEPWRVAALCAARGRSWADERAAGSFARFLKTFFANRNRRLERTDLLSRLAPPRHFLFSCDEAEYRRQEPVRRLWVTYHETFFAGGRVRTLQADPVLEVVVPTHG